MFTMSSCSPTLPTENGRFNAVSADENLSKKDEFSLECENHELEDEDEDGDVDFNPFLKDTPSVEASSSLSSEVECLDADVVESGVYMQSPVINSSLLIEPSELHDYGVGDIDHGEEIVMQTTASSAGAFKTSSGATSPTGLGKRKSAVNYESVNVTFRENECFSIVTDTGNDGTVTECNTSDSKKIIMDINDEDAICMRTRARYSLASFTLDELETFLQETDDEDDLHNIDDEEEYRKFLAAVLQGGNGGTGAVQENENVDEEDEDNDADFELEIEEALESDVDENIRDGIQEKVYKAVSRRPETRQNKRQKTSLGQKKKLPGQLNRPLRPILPYAPFAPFQALDGRSLMCDSAPHCLSSSANGRSVSIFTPQQIGRLHCLIYEHVQLLVQVFSLCVLDPSRQHIATQVRALLSEMLRHRDQLLASKRVPYPDFCFLPPYIHSSVSDQLPQIFPGQSTSESSAFDAQRVCPSVKNTMPPLDINFPFKARHQYISSGNMGQLESVEVFFTIPFVDGPVLSIMDVAPLNLVGSYMDDVSTAARDYQRGHLTVSCDTRFQRECLFPFQSIQSLAEPNGKLLRESVSPASKQVPSSTGDQTPKKTVAASLVERSKKQSVATVPKEIAKLAQRFFMMFNPALFPHKPPPAPVANRVLFTDAEDGLLARGLMQFNTDWKKIQQHFLPCKSKHQIFVRQKNRSCSRAPENPIKAVRRMKNSPLTGEEKSRIEEGLKVFKLDWMSIWKYIVPHRDPSLLARQWRAATGTQKSYKGDEAKKAKRRLYESMRRQSKPAETTGLVENRHQLFRLKEGWSTGSEFVPVPHSFLPSGVPGLQASSDKEDCSTDHAGGENNSGDDGVDNENEAYVHEAFLADWRPGNSSISSDFPAKLSQRPHTSSQSTHYSHPASSIQSNPPDSDLTTKFSKSKFFLRPYRARRNNSSRLVRLAPDLPAVNLPPSVRIMSQSAFANYRNEIMSYSAFANYRNEASSKVFGADEGSKGPAKENVVLLSAAQSGTNHPTKAGEDRINPVKRGTSHLVSNSPYLGDKSHPKEKDESDLHMHPLLFQPPDDGGLPYHSLNCSTGAYSSFNFSPKNYPQLNLSLFHNPQQAMHTASIFSNSLKSKRLSSSSLGIDFHPLLKRTDGANNDSMAATQSVAQPFCNAESSRTSLVQLKNPVDAVLGNPHDKSSSMATHTMISSPNARINELDLDIHLSFTAQKEKGRGIETQTTSSSLNQFSQPHTVDRNGKHDLGTRAMSIQHGEVNRIDVNNTVDQSLPEIVMEQEELSDSDEEMGENVEFEREEMADSEGEGGSESEQIGNLQNEDVQDGSLEKVVIDADNDDQYNERVCALSDGDVAGPLEGGVKFGSSTTDPNKDNQSSSSLCLSLNSYAPPLTKRKLPVTRNRKGSHLNGTLQSTTPLQQSRLNAAAATPSRKPRKRAQKPDSRLFKKIDASKNTCVTGESTTT